MGGGPSPHRRPFSPGLSACKTIKLADEPALDLLKIQLELVNESLPILVEQMEDGDYNMLSSREGAGTARLAGPALW